MSKCFSIGLFPGFAGFFSRLPSNEQPIREGCFATRKGLCYEKLQYRKQQFRRIAMSIDEKKTLGELLSDPRIR
ncbi:MAG: hypothetical protein IJL96_03515, partial [Clostridia bacterium]|nr:hypothetical protein [Clostridia bacterium]